MDAVEYKPVQGYPGYRVGNDGSVWSCRILRGLGYGRGTRSELSERWHLLKPTRNAQGYPCVSLCRSGKSRKLRVHCLVAFAFLGERPAGQEVRHKNGNQTDNRLENLAYGTKQQNEADKVIHGTTTRGERNHKAKLTAENIRSIREAHASGSTLYDLADRHSVSYQQISYIVRRLRWAHIA